ncbi:MAG: hypothetical protein LBU32_05310 [Clostridiales bacterium]|jgi:FlaA1/EpsC-like NDP-sugar epimerase|nr:hypothetical protein [Clostridiales bacterium]
MKRILLYGAVNSDRKFLQELLYQQSIITPPNKSCFEVIGFVDKNPALQEADIIGVRCYAPEELNLLTYDKIMITTAFQSEDKLIFYTREILLEALQSEEFLRGILRVS